MPRKRKRAIKNRGHTARATNVVLSFMRLTEAEQGVRHRAARPRERAP